MLDDQSRVIIKGAQGDYINANYVNVSNSQTSQTFCFRSFISVFRKLIIMLFCKFYSLL